MNRQRKYRLLITREVFEKLKKTKPVDRDKIKKFLWSLISGEWENNSRVEVLSSGSDSESYLYRMSLDGQQAIWEPLWAVNMTYKLGKRTEEDVFPDGLSRHIVFHKIEERAGDIISLKGQFYTRVATLDEKFLTLEKRPRVNELKYEEELFYLSPRLIDDVLEGTQRGLLLQLSEEELRVLAKEKSFRGPMLLAGGAGSGKTMVAIHWLLLGESKAATHGRSTQLFVTYSKRLREFSQAVFYQMLPADHHPITEFETYRALLHSLSRKLMISTNWPREKEMTLERFMKEFAWRFQDVDPVLLWDEIRSNIKGRCFDTSGKLIDLHTYEELSKRKGISKVSRELRERYYEVAKKYQEYLNENGLWDALDLARECLAAISHQRERSQEILVDRLACDEVQDLAPLEILLLVRLVKNPENIFFTGDVAQIINPSGFTWNGLKGLLGDWIKSPNVPDPIYLNQNYRSTSEIVELIDYVLKVREELIGTSEREHLRSSVRTGIKPQCLKMDRQALLNKIRNAQADAKRRMIIVKKPEEKEKILKELGEPRENVTVLSIEEAKGLESEGVILWGFSEPRHEFTRAAWDRVLRGAPIPGDLSYQAEYELNLLHVGLTRARRYLYLYPGEGIEKLLQPPYVTFVERLEFWETTPPEPGDLLELAEDLEDRAPEEARKYRIIAAERFVERGELERAAGIFSRVGEYGEAAKCYLALNDMAREKMMYALEAEKNKEWEKAGKHWMEFYEACEEPEMIVENLLKGAEAYERASQKAEGATETELLQKAAKACLMVARELQEKKGENFSVAKSYEKASEYFEKVGDVSKAIECLGKCVGHLESYVTREEEIEGAKRGEWLGNKYLKLAELVCKLLPPEPKERIRTLRKAESYFKRAANEFKHELERMAEDKGTSRYRDMLSNYVDALMKAKAQFEEIIKISRSIQEPTKEVKEIRQEASNGIQRVLEGALKAVWGAKGTSLPSNIKSEFPRIVEEYLVGRAGEILSDEGLRRWLREARRYIDSVKEISGESESAALSERIGDKLQKRYRYREAIEFFHDPREFYQKRNKFIRIADLSEKIAECYEGEGKIGNFIDEITKAGELYFRAGRLAKAKDCFGMGLARKEGEREKGEYCLEIARRLYSFDEKNASSWVEESIEHFLRLNKREIRDIFFFLERQLRQRRPVEVRCFIDLHKEATKKGIIPPGEFRTALTEARRIMEETQ